MNLELTTKITLLNTNIAPFGHNFDSFNKINTKRAVDTSCATAPSLLELCLFLSYFLTLSLRHPN